MTEKSTFGYYQYRFTLCLLNCFVKRTLNQPAGGFKLPDHFSSVDVAGKELGPGSEFNARPVVKGKNRKWGYVGDEIDSVQGATSGGQILIPFYRVTPIGFV